MLETVVLIGCLNQYSCKTKQGLVISSEQKEMRQPREQSLNIRHSYFVLSQHSSPRKAAHPHEQSVIICIFLFPIISA
jgi:hypothetical protein